MLGGVSTAASALALSAAAQNPQCSFIVEVFAQFVGMWNIT